MALYQKRLRPAVDPAAFQMIAAPTAGDCGCGCGTPREERDCRPKYIRTKYDITPDTAATCFRPVDCRFRSPRGVDGIEAWVRPRGTLVWRVSYDAFERDDHGNICFRWDQHLFSLGSNRLEVEFRECGVPCGVVELRIRRQCAMDIRHAINVIRNPYCDPVAAPGGDTGVFSDIVGFQAALCGLLEPHASVVKLNEPARNRLRTSYLCRPVELILDDGVHHEIVQFHGFTGDEVLLLRGMSGTVPRRFPVGTIIRFSWTPANVLAAEEGCP